jgi:hypothetical protein
LYPVNLRNAARFRREVRSSSTRRIVSAMAHP